MGMLVVVFPAAATGSGFGAKMTFISNQIARELRH
jgi:hypothetical protein